MFKRLKRRLDWYRVRFTINNAVVGRAVELTGNKVRMDGLTFSVDCQQISTSHKSTLAFGLHEMEERTLIKRWLPRDLPVVEVGGGLGVVACLTNRTLTNPDRHVVVEANPGMIAVLKCNRDLNGCRFEILNKAIGYNCEYVDLGVDAEFVGSSVLTAGKEAKTVKVAATTLSDLMSLRGFRRAGIICDIEGTEVEVIKQELPRLGAQVQYFMAEMHPAILGQTVVEDLLNNLLNLGFILQERLGDSVFFKRP